jgi:hypothetical protein
VDNKHKDGLIFLPIYLCNVGARHCVQHMHANVHFITKHAQGIVLPNHTQLPQRQTACMVFTWRHLYETCTIGILSTKYLYTCTIMVSFFNYIVYSILHGVVEIIHLVIFQMHYLL